MNPRGKSLQEQFLILLIEEKIPFKPMLMKKIGNVLLGLLEKNKIHLVIDKVI